MTVEDKKEILSRDYVLAICSDIEKMGYMCNLGEGICERAYERGINQGIEQGETLKVVLHIKRMYAK